MRRRGFPWLGLMLALGLALSSSGGAAWSQPPQSTSHPAVKLVLPRPDPPGHWRLMTQSPATTTSHCVGKVTTPMCAVDTILACFVREDDNLCRVALGLNKMPGLTFDSSSLGEWEKYRVLWAGRKPTGPLIRHRQAFYRDWRSDVDGLQHPWPPGDVKFVIRLLYCNSKHCPPRRYWGMPMIYLVKPTPAGWAVVTYHADCGPQERDLLDCRWSFRRDVLTPNLENGKN